MYYPMRVVRSGRYKLIWNIAHPLPFPFASDLWNSATWQAARRGGPDSLYGKRTIKSLRAPPEVRAVRLGTRSRRGCTTSWLMQNHHEVLVELQRKLTAFQQRTGDPWILKWQRE